MFEQSQVIRQLGELLISEEEQFVHLSNCKICYLYSDHAKQNNGKIVYADTETVHTFTVSNYHL